MNDTAVKLRCLKTGQLYNSDTASFYSDMVVSSRLLLIFRKFLHWKSLIVV